MRARAVGSSANATTRMKECQIEKEVSKYIRKMPFLWLEVDDPPTTESKRSYVERNAIGLLSNYNRLKSEQAIDPPSASWLGYWCSNDKIRDSGLWNSDYTKIGHDPDFLDIFTHHIQAYTRDG